MGYQVISHETIRRATLKLADRVRRDDARRAARAQGARVARALFVEADGMSCGHLSCCVAIRDPQPKRAKPERPFPPGGVTHTGRASSVASTGGACYDIPGDQYWGREVTQSS